MAQSQEVIAYDSTLLQALDNSMTVSRMAPYLALAGGDPVHAYQVYLWNARLAKAFLYPLGVVEVTARNSMHRALTKEFGTADWVLRPENHYAHFNTATLRSHKVAKDRLLNSLAGTQPTADQMVAALSFDFWSNLFRPEYNALWATGTLLTDTFPLMPAPVTSIKARQLMASINHLRNRIAHHEPIHRINLQEEFDKISETVSYICGDTQGWMKKCSTVTQTLRAGPPKKSSLPGLQVSSTNIRQPIELSFDTSLTTALSAIIQQRPQVAMMLDRNGTSSLVTGLQILQFMEKNAIENSGGILISDETLSDVIANTDAPQVDYISPDDTTGDVLALFFPRGKKAKRPQYLIVRDDQRILGVIQNPAVKYA